MTASPAPKFSLVLENILKYKKSLSATDTSGGRKVKHHCLSLRD
jgi:hypothetical protein